MVLLSTLLIFTSMLIGFICFILLIIKFIKKDFKFSFKQILITWGICIIIFFLSYVVYFKYYTPVIKNNLENSAISKNEEKKVEEKPVTNEQEKETEKNKQSESSQTVENQAKVEEKQEEVKNNDANIPKSAKNEYKAKIGQVLEANKLNNSLTIKFKIEPSATNNLTIEQNGYNVEDLILNQQCDQFDTINYWAVAEMSDGSTSKVISFTVNKDLIQKVKNKEVLGKKIVDKADNVWILPSLKKK